MSLEDILVALRAVDEGAIDREALSRLLSIIDSWDRGGLHSSCGELLTRQFRVDPSKVRRWEREITGQARRRIGRYQLKRKVGQGGMGLVFEAIDPSLGRSVALKLLAGDRLENPTSVQRFLREAKSAGSFNHPNIVHAYDAGIDGDLPYLVMEFIDGENLYQVLKRRGVIPTGEGIGWFVQGARALEVLERQRWVHGDVKPSNFIITRDGVVKLADLGLCGPPGKPRAGMTAHGTPPYIAPEVLSGDHIDHRADLYALGATMYHLLAGRPHRTSRSIDQLRAEMAEPIRPLVEVGEGIPPDLGTIVMRLLEERPEDRYQGGVALLSALEPLLPEPSSDPDATTQFDSVPVAVDAVRPRRGIWLALVVSVVAVGIAIGIVAGPRFGDGDERPSPGGGTTSSGIDPVDAGALHRAALWESARADRDGDFPASFEWLAGEGSGFPETDRWRTELALELSAAAAGPWEEVAEAVEGHRATGRYHAALEELDRFPAQLRAGSFDVAWRQAGESILSERHARLARLLLDFDSAAGPLQRWQLWRSLDSETSVDLAWYRLRIRRELGGLPFLVAIDAAMTDSALRSSERPRFVRSELLEGRLPEPWRSPGERILEEIALGWLASHPELAGVRGSLLEKLDAAGLLDEIDPTLLGVLLAECEVAADPLAEIEAARLAEEANAARRVFDRDGAEERWARLAAPRLASTVAARTASDLALKSRTELQMGAFLRSGAFVARVRGEWGEIPTFRWEGEDPHLLEEWRGDRDRWPAEPGGRRARGGEPQQRLELSVPFQGMFDLVLEVGVPDGSWVLVVGRGDAAIGFAGGGGIGGAEGVVRSGECRAASGTPSTILLQLHAGGGAPWILPADPENSDRLRIELHYEAGLWRLGDNPGLHLATADDPPPAWIWLAIPAGGLLRDVEIQGVPVPEWVDARKRVLAGPR